MCRNYRHLTWINTTVECDVDVDINMDDLKKIIKSLEPEEKKLVGEEFFGVEPESEIQINSLYDSQKYELIVELFPKLTVERLEQLKQELK